MKRFSIILSLIILIGCVATVPKSYSCTAICLKDNAGWVAGFNHDWLIKDALIMTNRRGVSKIAAPPDEKKLPQIDSKMDVKIRQCHIQSVWAMHFHRTA